MIRELANTILITSGYLFAAMIRYDTEVMRIYMWQLQDLLTQLQDALERAK